MKIKCYIWGDRGQKNITQYLNERRLNWPVKILHLRQEVINLYYAQYVSVQNFTLIFLHIRNFLFFTEKVINDVKKRRKIERDKTMMM